MRWGAARRTDSGATALEFSLVVLPFVIFTIGAADFGIFEYQISQTAAAARDGVRVAILRYDSSNAANVTAINAAVTARLGIRTAQPMVTISCSSTTCASAKPGQDTVTVTVKLVYQPITPLLSTIVGPQTVTQTATQTIVGLPT